MTLIGCVSTDLTTSAYKLTELLDRCKNLATSVNFAEICRSVSRATDELIELINVGKQAMGKLNEAETKTKINYSYEDGVEIDSDEVNALLDKARSLINATINPKNPKLISIDHDIDQIPQ